MGFERSENNAGWMVGGGIFAAFLASVCCIGPLVLTLLGVSGAAVLARFDFLRVPLIGVVMLLFLVAGISLFRKRRHCEPGSLCADPKRFRRMTIAYWLGLAVAFLAVTSPHWIVMIF